MALFKKQSKVISPHMPKEVKEQGTEAIEKQMWFLRLFLLSVIFGFASGIVGGMVVNSSFFSDWLWGEGGAWKSLVNQTTVHQDTKFLNNDTLYNKAMAITVEIYANAEANKDGLLVPSQKVGSGFFLTSSGYLATSKKIFDKYNKRDLVIVDQERTLYKINKVFTDPISDLAIVKIDGNNFTSAPFIFEDDLVANMDVYLPLSRLGMSSTKVLAINALMPQTKADYYADSEDLYRFGFLKNSLDKNSLGAPILNGKGEVAGLLTIESDAGTNLDKFIKSSVIQTALNRVLEDQDIRRSFLGAHFQEVEFNKSLINGPKHGIILVSDPYRNLPSLDKKSPLLAAGLKSGDIILDVADESLTSWRTLPEILLDYKPGTKVKVKYLRGNQENTVTVELGTK